MKRSIAFLLSIFILITCCACKKEVPPIPDVNFSGNMTVTYKKVAMECKVTNDRSAGLSVIILKPELISGLTLRVVNGVSKIEYGSVSYELGSDKTLQTDFVAYLSDVLTSVVNTTTYTKLDNSYWKYTGKIKSTEYILLQDSVTGYPVSLRIPDIDLTIKFSNMKPIS